MIKNKKNIPVYISVAVVLFLCIFAYTHVGVVKKSSENNFSIGGTHLKIEIADTDEERTLGLSHRDSLAADSGLFFVFEKPRNVGIWMKDMKFSIDIIWIDENLRVIHVKEKAAPQSFPEIFVAPQHALYVLEVNAGFVEKNKIKVGDIVTL